MRLEINQKKRDPSPQNPIVLITGDGRTLQKDISQFLNWRMKHDVMAIGRSMNEYPGPVLHWANVDGADSRWWAEHLPKRNGGDFPIRHSLGDLPWYDVDWDIKDEIVLGDGNSWHGSTALFAVYVSLALGYKKILLAGCPLDGKGHWWQGNNKEPGPSWPGETYQAWLEFSLMPEAERVKSFSGYTAIMVGTAFREWMKA